MAVPSYTTDLNTFDLCENDGGTFGEFTNMVDGGSPDDTDAEDVIQGSFLTSAGCALKVGELQSIYADYGSGVTIPTDGAILIWNKFDAGGILAAYAAGGVRIVIGTSASVWSAWKAGGVDKTPNPYGGWFNYAINPTARTADYTNGSISTYNLAGMAISLTAAGPTKGQPFKIDALRYGRGTIIIEDGSVGDGYANFGDAAAKNDANDVTDGYNRWGLFSVSGGGYLWKGRMQIGTTTACEFDDSDAFILIDDVVNCTANFNTIEINHVDTIVNWTNVIFKALGTTSPGRLVMNHNSEMNLEACQFFGMGAFGFGGTLSVLTNCIWNRCGEVTQNAGTFDGCSFVESPAAVALDVGDNVADVTNCDFVSDGNGYAIEGFSTATSYNIGTLTFTGYASGDGSTGDEAIHVLAAAGTVTLNYTGAAPSVHSEGATIVKVGVSIDVTVTAKTAAGALIEDALVFLKAADGTGPFPFEEVVTSITNTGTLAVVAHTGHGMASNDYVDIQGASLAANNGTYQITVNDAGEYEYTMLSTPGSSPTGTITSTFVALFGLTNVSGIRTTSRVYGGDQPVTGWSRKSTSSPLYQEAVIVEDVDSVNGLSVTAVMISDE